MAKSDPKKYEGPIAARYGERLKQAALNVTTPPTFVEPLQAMAATEKVVELPARIENDRPQEQEPRQQEPRVRSASPAENTCIRVLVTTAERDELDTLLNNLSKAVGARVKLANVLRASINQLLNAEEQIVHRAQRARSDFGARPANSDALALARFEDQLRDVVEAGLVDAARRARL
jgi:23S rRNA maturation mini-RNase III